MTLEHSATPDYTMGFSPEIVESMRRSTADNNAAYLVPSLRPGFRVLDFGSGPGTISAGLAKRVAPGELHGIDMEESQVEIAKAVARASGVDNAFFHVGDVTELPFEDSYFDAVHCHNVLMHIPDTAEVLREVKRVLKPGGLIGCRELILDSSFTQPDFGVLRYSYDMFSDLLAADDGHPQMGKELKEHFDAAGFTNIRVSLSFDIFTTPADVLFIHGVANNWFLAPEIVEAAIKYGATTRELCDSIRVAYERWLTHPGAVCGLAYGEALAGKP